MKLLVLPWTTVMWTVSALALAAAMSAPHVEAQNTVTATAAAPRAPAAPTLPTAALSLGASANASIETLPAATDGSSSSSTAASESHTLEQRLQTFKQCMNVHSQQQLEVQAHDILGNSSGASSLQGMMNITYQDNTTNTAQQSTANSSDQAMLSSSNAAFFDGSSSSSSSSPKSHFDELKSRNAQLRGDRFVPAAIVEPASAADVAAVVTCANVAGLRFAARNGGHSYEASSLLHGGLVIDLTALQEFVVNQAAGSVTVGAGNRLGPLYAALTHKGYILPGGTCAGVGVSGLTLGGGIGHSTRALGVLADSVLAATVVLANGTTVHANATQHPNLFWAIRGGGPLYGIITSWTFMLHQAPSKVSVVRYKQPGCTEQQYGQVLAAFNAWRPWELPEDHAMVEIQCGYDSLHVQFWLWGPMAAANATIAASPVFKLPGWQPFVQQEFNWTEFVVYLTNLHDDKDWSMQQLTLGALLSKGFKDRSSFTAASLLPMAPLNATAIATQAAWMVKAQKHAFIQSRVLGGRVSAVNGSFNAFPWRTAVYENQVYSNSGDVEQDTAWVQGVLDALQPFVGPAEYYNYYHCVKDPWQSFFGSEHAARLQQIKKAYDPENRLLGGLHCQQNNIV